MHAGMLILESHYHAARISCVRHNSSVRTSLSRAFMPVSSLRSRVLHSTGCAKEYQILHMSSKIQPGCGLQGKGIQVGGRWSVSRSPIRCVKLSTCCWPTAGSISGRLVHVRSSLSFSAGLRRMAGMPSDYASFESPSGAIRARVGGHDCDVLQQKGQAEAVSKAESKSEQLDAVTPVSGDGSEFVRDNVGAIHLIMGPMFAGKTTALLQRVRKVVDSGRIVGLVKSDKDTRYGVAAVVSHDGVQMPCVAAPSLATFREHVGEEAYRKMEVIGIDEAQFFDDLFEFCQSAADLDHKTLIVAGLDGDFLRRRFGSALDLIPLADSVTKLHARCELCGQPAPFTFRKTVDTQTEVIGGADVYMPVCRHHFVSGQIAVETARTVLQVHESRQAVPSADVDSMAKPAHAINS